MNGTSNETRGAGKNASKGQEVSGVRDFDGWARRAARLLRAEYDYSGSNDAEEDPKRYLVEEFLGRPKESDWPLFLGGAEGVGLLSDPVGADNARGACARLVAALFEDEDALDVVPAEAADEARVALRFMVVERERAVGRSRLGEARVVARVSLDDPRSLAVEDGDEHSRPPYRGLAEVYTRLVGQTRRAAETAG